MRFFASLRMTTVFLRASALLLLLTAIISCATTPPARLDVRDVANNPQSYANQRVELTGYVLDYQPAAGDTYRTLNFSLGLSPNEKLAVTAAGYTAASIAKASTLVEEARRNQELITVVGKMKVEATERTVSRSELRLESVEYKGQKIRVTQGPRSQPGLSVGGWYFSPSIGIGATITP